MKHSSSFLAISLFCTTGWSQVAPAVNPAGSTKPAPSTSSTLKARGPEAVAQQDPNRVVATINGKSVTAQQAATLLKQVPEKQRQTNQTMESMLERLYMVKTFSDEAAKLNLEQQAPWKDQIQLDREQILAQAYLSHLTAAAAPQTEDPKHYYDAHPEEFDLAKLSGIVIAFAGPGTPASSGAARSEADAKQKADDLEKKIKSGTDIATLARTESDNQQSAGHGGDLGTLSAAAANIPADIKTAVFKMQAGQISEPIRTPTAFFIIKVDSRTKVPFEEAKAQIVSKQQADRNQAVMKQEVDKYKVQVQDPDFFASGASSASIPSLANPSSGSHPSSASAKP